MRRLRTVGRLVIRGSSDIGTRAVEASEPSRFRGADITGSMSTTADPKTRSFPRFYARVEQGGESSKGNTTGAMRYAGLIGAGIAELLHLKYLAPASVGDFYHKARPS